MIWPLELLCVSRDTTMEPPATLPPFSIHQLIHKPVTMHISQRHYCVPYEVVRLGGIWANSILILDN